MSINRQYNYIVSGYDDRDYVFTADNIDNSRITTNSSLKSFKLNVNKIEDQGPLGSCTSFGVTSAFEHLVDTLCNDKVFQASPMFNYTQSRLLDSVSLDSDPGTTLRSACGNLRLTGICKDSSWPYTISNSRQNIPESVLREAFYLKNMIDYFEVNRDRNVMKYIIGDLGMMVVIGFTVYSSFTSDETTRTGNVPYPDVKTEIKKGGHVVTICGWDDDKGVYIFVNQYSTSWGNGGYGTIQYKHFEDTSLVTEAKLLLPKEDFADKYQIYKAAMSPQVTTTKSESILYIIISIFSFVFAVVILIIYVTNSKHNSGQSNVGIF